MTHAVLIVDDEESIRDTFQFFLEQQDYNVVAAENLETAMNALNKQVFDVVVSDIFLGGRNGLDILKHVKKISPLTPVIIITGQPDIESTLEAVRHDAYDYLLKPVTKDMLLRMTRKALEHKKLTEEKHKLEQENNTYRKHLESLVEERTTDLTSANQKLNQEIIKNKHTQEALRESEKRYRAVVNDLPDLIFRFLQDRTLTFVNESFCTYFNKKKQHLLGYDFASLVFKEDVTSLALELAILNQNNPTITHELRVLGDSGQVRWQEWTHHVLTDESGAVVEYQCVGRDITERKALAQRQEKEAATFAREANFAKKLLMTQSIQGIADLTLKEALHTTDSEEGFVGLFHKNTNRLICSSFEAKPGMGNTLPSAPLILPITGIWKTILTQKNTLRLNDPAKILKMVTLPPEHPLIERLMVVPASYGKEVLGVIALRNAHLEYTLFDQMSVERLASIFALGIRRLKMEEEILRAKEASEEANKSKSDFLSNMSHEIRTPMNSILGIADILWDSELNAEQQEYVKLFRSSGELLLHIINDVLEFSKIESGKVELESELFNVRDVLENIMRALAFHAHEKNLEFSFSIAPDVPLYLAGDTGRLRQIILNLLGNAIKFTHQGEVTLFMEKVSPEPNKGMFTFRVQDTGIGIPENKLEDIFHGFTQGVNSTSTLYGGTGLGLSISRKLVELMGGHILAQSVANKGSSFSFTIPLDVIPLPKSAALKTLPLKNMRVLVVEDSATTQTILYQYLDAWGAIPLTAETGIEALKQINNAQKTQAPFDLILLDYTLQDFDGVRLHEIICEHYAPAPNMILMPPSHLVEVRAQAHKQNIPLCIKPVSEQSLLQAITCEQKNTPISEEKQTPQIPAPGTDPFPPLRILVVEDNQVNQIVMRAYLSFDEFTVDFAENGQIAVEKYKQEMHDLIFMDVEMPVLDGHAATQTIRQWEQGNNIPPVPILALTAHAFSDQKQKCLSAGCNAFLTKPVSKKYLLQSIRKYGSPRKTPPLRPFSQESEKTPETNLQPDTNNISLEQKFDFELLEELEELIPIFLEITQRDLASMNAALQRKDFPAIQLLSHRLKGAATSYGFISLGKLAFEMEQNSTNKPEALGSQLKILEKAVDNVEKKYKKKNLIPKP